LETTLMVCMRFYFIHQNICGISKAMWCAFRKRKQAVHKCEDKMDKYVDFNETCHATISTSNCKNAHWCTWKQHC
jgi:hypothetical protein